ncbi:5-formyltetrahydrofolate cyclo-ligase [Methylopila turkensis]|uniref:5-formyltetrahydrofolate cyclo-ligase n=1 Tax=Methylopila turkensis TaxID=1437816 RepID=A0A9W6N5U5_9HYPH|nr:5-formyltetrahydrofolate cyclo-ligase [Methylopila turkensis]GLK78597.1 5-formyltetrahydrofolate cyclo-ligase [Methylopila turkensis]
MTETTVPPHDAAALKAALRREVLERRSAISEADRIHAGAAVAAAGADLVTRLKPSRVSVFVAIRGEIATAPLMDRLHAMGVPLCLPVIARKEAPLVFRAWSPGEPLETKRFGLLEPGEGAAEVEPDLLFAPLAAFDARGFRLGYGGGFYDRTLENLRAQRPTTAIGLAFAGQEIGRVPTDPYDQKLDGMLTESGYAAFV